MLSPNFTLTDGSVDFEYHLVSQVKQDTLRTDIGSSIQAPTTLAVKHGLSGKGVTVVDRHLIQHQTFASDSDSLPVVINLTLAIPRGSSATVDTVKSAITQLFVLLAGSAAIDVGSMNWSNLAAVLRGES